MKIHIVKKGDSLYLIAKQYGVPLEKLIAYNPQISNPDVIDVGMKVKIPTISKPTTVPAGIVHAHTVVQGDTLWKLSKAWGVPLQAMIAANPQLKNPNALLTGETVFIPDVHYENQQLPGKKANTEYIHHAENVEIAPVHEEVAAPAPVPTPLPAEVIEKKEEKPVAPIEEHKEEKHFDLFAPYKIPAIEVNVFPENPHMPNIQPVMGMPEMKKEEYHPMHHLPNIPMEHSLKEENIPHHIMPAAEFPFHPHHPMMDPVWHHSMPNIPMPNMQMPVMENMPMPNMQMPMMENLPMPNIMPITSNMPMPNMQMPVSSNMPMPNMQMPVMENLPMPNIMPITSNMPMPNMQMPVMSNMPMPNMQMPVMSNIPMPNMQMPVMSNIPMPNMQMPVTSNMPVPNMQMPVTSNMPMPNMQMPVTSNMPMPNMQMPVTSNMPMPNMQMPVTSNMPMPNMSMPVMENMPMPNMQFPMTSNMPMPNMQFPMTSNMPMPNMPMPVTENLPMPNAPLGVQAGGPCIPCMEKAGHIGHYPDFYDPFMPNMPIMPIMPYHHHMYPCFEYPQPMPYAGTMTAPAYTQNLPGFEPGDYSSSFNYKPEELTTSLPAEETRETVRDDDDRKDEGKAQIHALSETKSKAPKKKQNKKPFKAQLATAKKTNRPWTR